VKEPLKSKASLRYQLASFRYAGAGIRFFFITGIKARIHTACGLCAFILAIILNLSALEWLVLLILVAIVLLTEIINTAIEKIGDCTDKTHDREVGLIKDLSAGAVLIAATTAFLGGLLLFVPKLLVLWK